MPLLLCIVGLTILWCGIALASWWIVTTPWAYWTAAGILVGVSYFCVLAYIFPGIACLWVSSQTTYRMHDTDQRMIQDEQAIALKLRKYIEAVGAEKASPEEFLRSLTISLQPQYQIVLVKNTEESEDVLLFDQLPSTDASTPVPLTLKSHAGQAVVLKRDELDVVRGRETLYLSIGDAVDAVSVVQDGSNIRLIQNKTSETLVLDW